MVFISLTFIIFLKNISVTALLSQYEVGRYWPCAMHRGTQQLSRTQCWARYCNIMHFPITLSNFQVINLDRVIVNSIQIQFFGQQCDKLYQPSATISQYVVMGKVRTALRFIHAYKIFYSISLQMYLIYILFTTSIFGQKRNCRLLYKKCVTLLT